MARVLVMGPHPDDQELGMGATIALLASQGHDVLLGDLTDGEPTPHGDVATRRRESMEALAALDPRGRVQRVYLGLTNRRVEHTIAARHAVAGLIRAHQAEIIFAPFPDDAHPDHVAGTRICEDARFDAKLTGLEMPTPGGYASIGPPIYARWFFYYYATHLRITPDPSFLVDVTGFEDHKLAAIAAYRSQFAMNPKNAGVPEWITASLRYFGSRAGTRSAEAFFTREPIALRSLASIGV